MGAASPAPLPPIGPEQAALMQRRVSINLATRDAALRPHLMRAMGSRLSSDRRELTLFLHAANSAQVLDDLRANGLVAVVFSEPTTHRTLQLKGSDARVVALEEGDAERVQTYIERFADEIGQLGFAPTVVKTMFDHTISDLVAVCFTPLAAFEQTPGPHAGEALNA